MNSILIGHQSGKIAMSKHIHFMRADDWVGLYIDGELVMEGHSLRVWDVVEQLAPDAEITSSWHEDDDDPYLSWKTGSCPKELPEEYRE